MKKSRGGLCAPDDRHAGACSAGARPTSIRPGRPITAPESEVRVNEPPALQVHRGQEGAPRFRRGASPAPGKGSRAGAARDHRELQPMSEKKVRRSVRRRGSAGPHPPVTRRASPRLCPSGREGLPRRLAARRGEWRYARLPHAERRLPVYGKGQGAAPQDAGQRVKAGPARPYIRQVPHFPPTTQSTAEANARGLLHAT